RARENRMRRQASLKLLAGDGAVLPFGDNTLHGITSFFALHHVDGPERLLMEADRVLAHDGALLIMDFRRDMSRLLFRMLDASWQCAFFFSAGRYGFRDSVQSAWRPEEIKSLLARNHLGRFQVHANAVELWITGPAS
ncbi:MAG: class I SAM-dependent methyltransferase, partial [Deltaproteobacteria bacterium]|nr:class I SAM-dependent methyltransferase [Deltaproteobacteria bacterium]